MKNSSIYLDNTDRVLTTPNQIICGDSKNILSKFKSETIDLVITDPPYLCNYIDRTGRSVANDTNSNSKSVLDVFDEVYRVMKPNSYCISFYGWNAIHQFAKKWHEVGFKSVGHIVWVKEYASSIGFTKHMSESAFVLIKGNPAKPQQPISNVQEWHYTGNKSHPTEKSVSIIAPLVKAFSKAGNIVLDPFSGSGTTAVAAALNDRDYIGIELEEKYCHLAQNRLKGVARYKSVA